MTRLATLIFDHVQPKNFWSAFNFCESISIYKKWVIPSVHSLDTVNFRVPSSDWSHPFLTTPTPKILKQLLILMNLYQHAKNEAVSLLCSGEIVDLKILEFHCDNATYVQRGGTENPGFRYWLVSFNNITIN